MHLTGFQSHKARRATLWNTRTSTQTPNTDTRKTHTHTHIRQAHAHFASQLASRLDSMINTQTISFPLLHRTKARRSKTRKQRHTDAHWGTHVSSLTTRARTHTNRQVKRDERWRWKSILFPLESMQQRAQDSFASTPVSQRLAK